MCIAVWIWQAHPIYPLLLLLNRDEYHNRPTKPVSWWEDSSNILGGRDCLAGGTWLACSRDGKLAFLTNFRAPNPMVNAKSRGELPVRFLESDKTPFEFAEEVVKEGAQYNGFNLILADLCSKTMIYVSNRAKGGSSIQEVFPGIHVLSNANLDTPWYKAQRLHQNFEELLNKFREEQVPVEEMVEQLMTDTVKADEENLPNTGCKPEWELSLSSIFIGTDTDSGRYGTRSMAALTVKASGEMGVSIYRQRLNPYLAPPKGTYVKRLEQLCHSSILHLIGFDLENLGAVTYHESSFIHNHDPLAKPAVSNSSYSKEFPSSRTRLEEEHKGSSLAHPVEVSIVSSPEAHIWKPDAVCMHFNQYICTQRLAFLLLPSTMRRHWVEEV